MAAAIAAIFATLGFSCHNEPNYSSPGMSNGPTGSGSGPASVSYGGPPTTSAPAPSTSAAPKPDSTKAAATKRP
jgi:hypothetical protein